MFVSEGEDSFLIVFQEDHADLSGQLAAHWGNRSFSRPVPYEDVVYAASLHDLGWMLWDYYPQMVGKNGTPAAFIEVATSRFDVYSRFYKMQVNGVAENKPYAGLLLALHAAGIWDKRYKAGPSRTRPAASRQDMTREQEEYVKELEGIQQRLRQRLESDSNYRGMIGEDSPALWANYKLIQVWDRLSQYCFGVDTLVPEPLISPTPLDYEGKEGEIRLEREKLASDDGLVFKIRLDPYPFDADPQNFFLRSFRIANEAYKDNNELARSILQGSRQQVRIITSGKK